jgi:hypothetical protein
MKPIDCFHNYLHIGFKFDETKPKGYENVPIKWCCHCGTIIIGQIFTHPRPREFTIEKV